METSIFIIVLFVVVLPLLTFLYVKYGGNFFDDI